MKSLLASVGLVFFFVLTVFADQQTAIQYFRFSRDITVTAPAVQNYVIVDADLWQYSRAKLEDIRLYDGETQIPYALQEQRGGATSEEDPVETLNLGTTGNGVQFDLDLGTVPEYDRIRLQLDAKNFVINAEVEGRTARDTKGIQLGRSTLYDFTRQKLGSNSILQFPASSFRFLHVTLSQGIRADQIKGVYVFNVEDKKAFWDNAGKCQSDRVHQSNTVLTCSVTESAPVNRIEFQVNPSAVNFRRSVTVTDASGSDVTTGQIERIKIAHQGQSIISENLALDVPDLTSKQFKITIQNGDDAPLPLELVQPVSIERRIYFDPQGKSALKLYLGDEKLSAPDFDYAKFFKEDKSAVEARLSAVIQNPAYTGRPDDRPWSERHKFVVWLAMILAVGVLAVLAIRGFKADVKSA